jgi:hypothetical protein
MPLMIALTSQDMPELNTLLTSIEQYDKMTIQYLLVSNASFWQYDLLHSTIVTIHIVQFSKIRKVMQRITLLDEEKIPRNAEFNFHGRAQILVDKWRNIMHPNQPKDAAEGKTENGDETAVNMSAMEMDVGGSWVMVNGDALVE